MKLLNNSGVSPTLLISLLLLISSSAISESDTNKQPGIRITKTLSGDDLYPSVKRLELADVHDKYNKKSIVLVDARNSFEYGTLHIKEALNLSVTDPAFVTKVRALRASDNRPIVFYCNGLTCMKSFRAAKTAMDASINDVYVYPYGVLSWAKAHPADALLFGDTLNVDQLIDEEEYKSRKLAPLAFNEMREKLQDKALIIDIRTSDEVGGVRIWPGIQYNVKQDNEAIKRYVDKAKAEKKTLLVYDESGHQIRWIQYYLRKEGLTDYYFLDGGHENYMRMIDKDGQYVMSEYMRERMKAKTLSGQVD